MATLHLLSNPDAAASCLAAMAGGDALLLLGEGVFALSRVTSAARLGVLGDDLASRGIVPPPGIEPLSQADLVNWVVACERSVTWA